MRLEAGTRWIRPTVSRTKLYFYVKRISSKSEVVGVFLFVFFLFFLFSFSFFSLSRGDPVLLTRR